MRNEIYIKLETTDLKHSTSVFAISVLRFQDQTPVHEQFLCKPEYEPTQATLDYLGMSREMYEQIISDAPNHITAVNQMLGIFDKIGEKAIVYVWSEFTTKRFMDLLQKANVSYYGYFKTLPIAVSEVYKFVNRHEPGVVPMRFEEAKKFYDIEDTSYLVSLHKLVNKIDKQLA